jgi:hypothetical protein
MVAAHRGGARSGALVGAAVFLVLAAPAHAVGTAIICLAVSNFCLEMLLGRAWVVPMDAAGLWSGTSRPS